MRKIDNQTALSYIDTNTPLLTQMASMNNKDLFASIIDDWDSFNRIEYEWNNLLGASRAKSIFQEWEWIKTWVSVACTSVEPFTVVVRNSHEEIVGIAPFYLTEYKFLHTLRYRVLRVMGDYASGAECLDWIVRRGEEALVYPMIAGALGDCSWKWDCIWIPYVPDWTDASTRISTACCEQGFCCHSKAAEFAYFILPSNYDIFLKQLSGNRRSELRRQQKAVFGHDHTVIRRCLEIGEVKRYTDALFELHHKRWKSRGEEGCFKRKPAEAAFYREFLPIALKNGWLWLYGLEVRGEFKAIQVGYVYDGVFYQLQEGFDPGYIGGVGNVLRAKIIEDCIAAGVKCYDFLGEMSEHKRRWSANVRAGRHLFIGNRNVKSRVLFAKEDLAHWSLFAPVASSLYHSGGDITDLDSFMRLLIYRDGPTGWADKFKSLHKSKFSCDINDARRYGRRRALIMGSLATTAFPQAVEGDLGCVVPLLPLHQLGGCVGHAYRPDHIKPIFGCSDVRRRVPKPGQARSADPGGIRSATYHFFGHRSCRAA